MKKLVPALLAAFLAGCGINPEIVAPPITQIGNVKEEYLMGVGDQLTINVWRNPELSVAVPIRPDGRISTPLVGDIQAAGLSPEALAEVLKQKLSQFVRTPEVTVIVVSPRSTEYLDRVRVVGAVTMPKSVQYREGMTVIDLILESGGVTDFASANKAKLYRTLENGEKKAFPVYLEDILTEGDLKSNYKLQPLDVITVPERIF